MKDLSTTINWLFTLFSSIFAGAITSVIGATLAKSARDTAKSESLAEFRGAVQIELEYLKQGLDRIERKVEQFPHTICCNVSSKDQDNG
jgi:hypothetical protein